MKKVSEWDDGMEAFPFRVIGKNSKGYNVVFDDLYKNAFGLCFSLEKDAEAFWRAGKDLCLGTTVGKVFNCFYGTGKNKHLFLHMGKVQYKEDSFFAESAEMMMILKKIIHENNTQEEARAFLLKRESFSYEKEVRMIFSPPNSSASAGLAEEIRCPEFFDLRFSRGLFDDITISPLRKKCGEDRKIKYILDKLGYSGCVQTSTLYDTISVNIPW